MISLHILDILVILIYFAIVLFIGFKTSISKRDNTTDYLLAGRTLTLPMFVATFVSTWYGGALGIGEMTYRYGISNWVMQGLPYYFFGLIFALTIAKKVRRTNLFTIPDKLEESYDKKTAVLGSILTFILVTPAPYILMIAVFIQLLFGFNLLIALIISSIFSISYLYSGGFRSDVYTDIFEFFVMFLGFVIILPFAFINYGGAEFLSNQLPPFHLTFTGGNPIQYIIVWFFIALWTMVDPTFHQRCYAAKDEKTARNGILVSIIFWFIFDCLTTTTGLYSRAILPNIKEPLYAYPLLAETILPPFAKGLFYIGILATIMSTLNSYAFISATTIGKDFYGRIRNFENEKDITRMVKIGLIFTSILSIILAALIPSVINIWYTIGTVIIPGLLIPVISGYFKKISINSNQAFTIMLSGWLSSLLCLIYGYIFKTGETPEYPFGIEPMYVGLLLTFALLFLFKIFSNPKKNNQSF